MSTVTINSIPVELFTRILAETLPDIILDDEELKLGLGAADADHRLEFEKILNGNPPVVFLRICRYWREVTQKTPALWTDVRFSMTVHEGLARRTQMATRYLRYCLDLSRDLPVSLYLLFGSPGPLEPQEASYYKNAVRELVGVIVSSQHRWERVNLWTPCNRDTVWRGGIQLGVTQLAPSPITELMLTDVKKPLRLQVQAQVPGLGLGGSQVIDKLRTLHLSRCHASYYMLLPRLAPNLKSLTLDHMDFKGVELHPSPSAGESESSTLR